MSMILPAAEQIFYNGGYSSLIWLGHPVRPFIFLIHHTGYWQGWPDMWNGQGEPSINGARRGFAHFLLNLRGQDVDKLVGEAIRTEQSYTATVQEHIMPEAEWIVDTFKLGWTMTDSYGRVLCLNANGMTWGIEHVPLFTL